MQYYLTQAGLEFLEEGVPVVYKPVSSPNSIIFSKRHLTIPAKGVDVTRQDKIRQAGLDARAKVFKRVKGKGLTPTQLAKRIAVARQGAELANIRGEN